MAHTQAVGLNELIQDFRSSIPFEPTILKRARKKLILDAFDALLSRELNEIERRDAQEAKDAFLRDYPG